MMAVRRGERGSALIFVLMIALLLSVAVAGALSTVRLEAQLVKARVEQMRTHEALRGALNLAVYRRARLNRQEVSTATITVGGIEIEVSERDNLGRLDLNRAPPNAFAELGLRLGATEGDAAALRAGIEKSRQPQVKRMPNVNSAERSMLVDPAELLKAPGVAPTLVQCLAPYVSVFGRASAVDPRAVARPPSKIRDTVARAIGATGVGGQAGERVELFAQTLGRARRSSHLGGVLMVGESRDHLFDWVSLMTSAANASQHDCPVASH